MQKEILVPNLRELNFYGEGKAEAFERNSVIVSLRNPNDNYNFARGERIYANCKDDGRKVPVIVISNDKQNLSSHEIPVLALDGTFSAEMAAEMLKKYPSYENTTVNSSMLAIALLHTEKFDSLSKALQEKLLNPDKPIISLIKDKDFREIFFPTMCYWVAEFGGTLNDWTDFLFINNLIDKKDVSRIKEYNNDHGRIEWQPELLKQLSISQNSKLFKPLVSVSFS